VTNAFGERAIELGLRVAHTPLLLNQRGVALERDGLMQQAFEVLSEARSIDPANETIAANWGLAASFVAATAGDVALATRAKPVLGQAIETLGLNASTSYRQAYEWLSQFIAQATAP
jgi:hypothetical protein